MFIAEEEFIDGFRGGKELETRGRLCRFVKVTHWNGRQLWSEPAFDLGKTKTAISEVCMKRFLRALLNLKIRALCCI